MIHLQAGNEKIGIPADLLAVAMRGGIPPWLMGDEPCQNAGQMAIRAAAKGLIHLVIGYAVSHPSPAIPPPNPRCAAAKANIVRYGFDYLVATGLPILEREESFTAEGERDVDGTFIISGLAPTIAPAAISDESERVPTEPVAA